MRDCDKFPGCIQDMFHLRYHKYLRRIEVSGLARLHKDTCTLWIDHGDRIHTGEIPAHTTIWDIHHQDRVRQQLCYFLFRLKNIGVQHVLIRFLFAGQLCYMDTKNLVFYFLLLG